MKNLIDEIITEVKLKYPELSKTEIERIADSQFECIVINMRAKGLKSVNLIHIGKFKPTEWLKYNRDAVFKEFKRDIPGL